MTWYFNFLAWRQRIVSLVCFANNAIHPWPQMMPIFDRERPADSHLPFVYVVILTISPMCLQMEGLRGKLVKRLMRYMIYVFYGFGAHFVNTQHILAQNAKKMVDTVNISVILLDPVIIRVYIQHGIYQSRILIGPRTHNRHALCPVTHDDVIKLKHFRCYCRALCEGNPSSPVDSPNKGQWRGINK